MPDKIWITGAFDRLTVLTLAFVAAVLLITFAAYYPGLSGPLFFDDLPQLQPLIDQSADKPATLFTSYLHSSSGPSGRPVAMASFIGSAVSHGPDTWWWKYDNVMLHLVCGLLVFWCAALLWKQVSGDGRPWLVGAIAAAFWMLHPLHVSTVLFTVQRMTELSSLFVLAGLISYIKGRQRLNVGDRKGWVAIAAAFVVFFPLSVLSKESALLFPAFCGLLEWLVFRFEAANGDTARLKILHGVFAGVYVLVVAMVLLNFSSMVLSKYAVRDFSLLERIYTEFRVVVVYLSQLLLPSQGKMGFFHDDFQHSTSLIQPVTTILSASLLLVLGAVAFKLRQRLPLFTFGIAFFFVGHALESSIFALELMFEHRNHLPSFGIAIAVIAALQAAVSNRKGLLAFVVVGLVAFSFLTWQRSITWSSPATMYEFMYRVHPESPRLNLTFANFQTRAENYAEARNSLARIQTGLGPTVHSLFLDCLEHGKVSEQRVRGVSSQDGGWVDSHVTSSIEILVRSNGEGRCVIPHAAVVELVDHLLGLPARTRLDRRSLYLSRARLLESQNDIDGAVYAFSSAHDMQPDNALGLYLAANTLANHGRLDEAATFLSAAYAVEASGGFQNKRVARTMYLNLGALYTAQQQPEKALPVYSEGIESVPDAVLIYLKKVEVLIQLGRYQEARQVLDNRRMLDAAGIGEHTRTIQQLREFLSARQE